MKLSLFKVSSIILLMVFTLNVIAEDVLIVHQGYANSHIKWKNRLEDAGHTVTSVNIDSDFDLFPSNTTSYEQIYDLIDLPYHLVQDYSGDPSPAIATAYKALLARGGTLYLQTENPLCCDSRNQNIVDFIEEVGGGTVTYGDQLTDFSTDTITIHNSEEDWLDGFSGTVTFN